METYYKSQHLAEFAKIGEGSPDLGKKFFDYYGAVFAAGALTAREKSLIALAVAHAVQCPYCIDAYTQDCQQKGADFEQMTEALLVNPHSAEELSDALGRALAMPLDERIRRWRNLMAGVEQYDVMWWLKRFTDALTALPTPALSPVEGG